jgi:tight adherence protein B
MREMMIQNPGLVTAMAAVAMVVLVSLIGGIVYVARSRHRVQDRITRMKTGPGKQKKIDLAQKAKELRLRKAESRSDQIAKSLVPNPAKVRAQLERTGTGMTLSSYLILSILAALLSFVVGKLALDLGLVASLAAGVAGGIILPWLYIKRVASRRVKRFIRQLPDALELMVRGVKAGLPVTECFQLVTTEMDSPIADEFSTIVDGVKLGQNLDVALWDTEKRLGIAEWRFFIVSLAIQRETGGNLAETLANLADVLRKRQQIRLKVKAFSSEARAGAWILGILPFAMFGIIYMLNRPYVMQLFTDPRGVVIIAIGCTLLTIGIFVMAKMIRFEI